VRNSSCELLFEVPIEQAHRAINLHELDHGQVCLKTPEGNLLFRKNKAAARDVEELLLQGLRSDAEFRERQKRLAKRGIPLGIVLFVVCSGLFSLYCWWSIGRPDPPRGSLLFGLLIFLGCFIYVGLAALLGVALAGPWITYCGWRDLRRVKKVERQLADHPGKF
jgi:hypothetical protein